MTKGEAVICVSKSVAHYVRKAYSSADKEKLHVVHRGVDTVRYNPDFRPEDTWLNTWKSQYGHLEGKTILTLPGRITGWKGHRDFIEIIKHLKNQKLPVHGLIVGDVHPRKQVYYQSLIQEIERNELENDITFLGHRKDIHEIFSLSDIVVSCSKSPEAFGRVTLEALSLGRPVFAYAHGGVKEQLEVLFPDGMIEVDNVSSMKTKIKEFIQSSGVSFPKENSKFTLDKMNQKILKVYEASLLSSSDS